MDFVALKLADGSEVPLDRLQVIGLQEGDYLVIRPGRPLSQEVLARLQQEAEKAFPEAAGRIRVLEPGMELDVVRPEKAAANTEKGEPT